ncbi:hypothetical protein [Streptomyces shenzhenensis]|uniref:hypothetical protein n=1 Tax=Streptomyces TaxID=1883 RepID=UPI001F3C9B90|nr:hypothetical protein [Streptomyces shenzhenensis]
MERTAGSYHVRGRSRRLPLARWAAVGPITGVFLIRFTVGGQWQEPVNWLPVVFWPFVGALITVVGFLTPRRPVELELTRDAITSVVGRRRHSYAWHSIEEITARRAVVRGRDMRF